MKSNSEAITKFNDAANARWYCLSREGLAQLCADKADAIKTAKNSDIVWPRGAPHRAVQLVEK